MMHGYKAEVPLFAACGGRNKMGTTVYAARNIIQIENSKIVAKLKSASPRLILPAVRCSSKQTLIGLIVLTYANCP